MREFSHLDEQGRARMVDVGEKPTQRRMARAEGSIALESSTVSSIRKGGLKKGEVLAVAQIAGIQAAKQTSALIPLCHPLGLDKIEVELRLQEDKVTATSEVCSIGRTGVEMEALVAVSVALLTVYDMCKSVDRNMCIGDLRLLEKTKRDDEGASK